MLFHSLPTNEINPIKDFKLLLRVLQVFMVIYITLHFISVLNQLIIN